MLSSRKNNKSPRKSPRQICRGTEQGHGAQRHGRKDTGHGTQGERNMSGAAHNCAGFINFAGRRARGKYAAAPNRDTGNGTRGTGHRRKRTFALDLTPPALRATSPFFDRGGAADAHSKEHIDTGQRKQN